MTISTSNTKAATLAFVQALIAGTNKHLPNANFTLGNAAYTSAALVTLLQSLANAITAVNDAETAAKDAAHALSVVKANVGPVLQAYKSSLLAMYGAATQTLADFGLAPRKKRAPLTLEQKAAAKAKAAATRKARGTASKKQKLAVKGNVTGVTVTPVTAPGAPPPTQPAPAAASTEPAPAAPVVQPAPAAPSTTPAVASK